MASIQPPPPPRRTGNDSNDIVSAFQWMYDFYNKVVVQGIYLTADSQTNVGDFDPSSLPDPASTTTAKAQKTANEAYTQAQKNKSDIATEKASEVIGEFSIADTSDAVEFVFSEGNEQPDDNYVVLVEAKAFTGSPTPDSAIIVATTKEAGKFTVQFADAPGAGASRSFTFLIKR